MRTTLTVDDDVALRLKQHSRATGASFKAVVNEMLRCGLALQDAAASDPPFEVKASPLGLRAGLSYDNIGALLERLERADEEAT